MSGIESGPAGSPLGDPPVVFAAAHAGFRGLGLPIGGGGAVADRLALEWRREDRWPFILWGAGPDRPFPDVEYQQIPTSSPAESLTRLSERQYARFCTEFGDEVTARLLRRRGERPPVVVLNDLAEGPEFRVLSAAGMPLITLFHVDIVDYFCRIYLKGRVRPETASAWYELLCRRGWEPRVPRLLRLAFGKQREAVFSSRALVVPSSGMAEILHRCYPTLPLDRVRVIPWGCWREDAPDQRVGTEIARLETLCGDGPRPRLIMLSRISPEKGHDLLLRALLVRERWERRPVTLLIAGDAAYMRGQTFLDKVRRLAGRLRQSRVFFIGYADAATKEALFRVGDLYLHPSRHESYGLTLCEALSAGMPVVTTDHYSAADQVALAPANRAWIVPREDVGALAEAIDGASVYANQESCHPTASTGSFSRAARILADLVDEIAAGE